jgi:hypothetical protein
VTALRQPATINSKYTAFSSHDQRAAQVLLLSDGIRNDTHVAFTIAQLLATNV